MKMSISELRRNTAKLLDAIGRNETVTLLKRGKAIARIAPIAPEQASRVAEHPAFGMWASRDDLADPAEWVRGMRSRRAGGSS